MPVSLHQPFSPTRMAPHLTEAALSNKGPTFLLGISGPSSAGKTILAHLLYHVFAPHVTLILHGDDFCKDISLIPTVNGYIDADGPHGIDFNRMAEVLDQVRASEGVIPKLHKSWQIDVYPDQEDRALKMVPRDLLEKKQAKIAKQLEGSQFTLVLIEGFLLYNMDKISRRLDGRLFIRLDYHEAKHRRLTKPLYGDEAKEGEFWKTEDYFNKTVWRNYVEQHHHLFEHGNVEGNQRRDYQPEIWMQDGLNVDLGQTLDWAVDSVLILLKKWMARPSGCNLEH